MIAWADRPPLFALDTWQYDKTKTDNSAASDLFSTPIIQGQLFILYFLALHTIHNVGTTVAAQSLSLLAVFSAQKEVTFQTFVYFLSSWNVANIILLLISSTEQYQQKVKFEVLQTASMKMAVLLMLRRTETDRHFWGAYCLNHQDYVMSTVVESDIPEVFTAFVYLRRLTFNPRSCHKFMLQGDS